MRTSLVSTLFMSGLAAAQYSSNVSSSACPTGYGVHIIVARASLEQEGYGIIGIVKDALLARLPGSNAEFVVYPATINNYIPSESDGVVAERALIDAFEANCPNSPLVLMGYSQGAQVTADSIVGQEVDGFPTNASIADALPESVFNQTAAVILMGDPTFNLNETFHVGNASKNSIFPRRDTARFDIDGLANRTQSYCDYGDPYCAAGNMLGVHLGYVQEYGLAAENFVVNQVRLWWGNPSVGLNATTTTASSGRYPSATMPSMVGPSGVRPTGTAVITGTRGAPSATGPTKAPGPVSVSTPSTPTASSPIATKNAAVAVRGGDAISGLVAGGIFAWMML